MQTKRLLSLLLVLLLLASASGCREAPAQPAAPAAPTVTDVPEATVVDGAGRTLALPDDPQGATIASVYAVSASFLKALGLTERVKAVNVKSRFWTETDAFLAAAGTVGRGTVDLEALANFAPDVLVHRSNDPETVEAVSRLGVAVLCITVEDWADIQETLRLLGTYFGADARAEEVCAYLEGKFAAIDDIVAGIPAEDRVTALAMGGELGRIAGGDMLQSWMIEKAGGVCVANEIANDRRWMNVGVETIFQWDPEVLFCTSSTALEYTVDALYADGTWSALRAVENRRVHIMPARIDSWDMPGIGCALGTYYMLYRMYPDHFSMEQMQAEIDDYYTFFFGQTYDRDYLGYRLEE